MPRGPPRCSACLSCPHYEAAPFLTMIRANYLYQHTNSFLDLMIIGTKSPKRWAAAVASSEVGFGCIPWWLHPHSETQDF